jgi:hypothetical protein
MLRSIAGTTTINNTPKARCHANRGRSRPALSLTYDCGSGNSAFGLGWTLALAAITRKTDEGLPRYRDGAPPESDTFVLSGAEDLVPVMMEVGDGFQPAVRPRTLPDGSRWTVQRYRPRVEGLFARIERWTRQDGGDVHWRSISRDDVTTMYGTTAESRIADPSDPRRIVSWLICESYDDRDNAMVYRYGAEGSDGVERGGEPWALAPLVVRGSSHPTRTLASGVMGQCALAPQAAGRAGASSAPTLPMKIGDGARHCARPAFGGQRGSAASAGRALLVATSATGEIAARANDDERLPVRANQMRRLIARE